MKTIFSILVFAFVLTFVNPLKAQTYAIEKVSGDLYRFQSNAHYSVFLVTKEGVIVTDPISEDASTWLKGEIKKRFDLPIKYVLYSHSDADHTTGGQVFADTAEFVAQQNAREVFRQNGHSPTPDTVFDSFYKLEFGGKTVELHYPAPSHTDNLVIMNFLEEKAIFIVDAVAVNRLPYRDMGSYYYPGIIDFLSFAEKLDFDILIPGHGSMGNKADLSAHKKYLEVLYKTVSILRNQGIGVEEAKAQIQLEDYEDWGNYSTWLPLNIEGMYRILDEEK